MQPKNIFCFFLSILAIFLFLAGSSLQAQVNEKIGIPFHNKPWEKGQEIKMPAHVLRDGKMVEFEHPFRQSAHHEEILRTLSKRTAGQATQNISNGLIFLLDTAIAYTTQDTARYSFSYSANGNTLSSLEERWTNGQWENSYRGSFTYDKNRILISELYENWATAQWENSSRYTYTHDANGWYISYLYEQWTNGQWVNSYRYTATYDARGDQLSYLAEQWISGGWVNLYQYTYTYDAKGNQLTWLYGQMGNGLILLAVPARITQTEWILPGYMNNGQMGNGLILIALPKSMILMDILPSSIQNNGQILCGNHIIVVVRH